MENLIKKYLSDHLQNFEAGLSFFRQDISFDTALKHAILSEDKNNRRFAHQKRIKKVILENKYFKISAFKKSMSEATHFEDILKIIENSKEPGFGQLCCYDSALRIAEYKKISIDHIYLQAGALEGAKNLFNVYNKKLILISDRFINKSDLPEPLLKKLDEKVIEDFLCVMKAEILLLKQ